MNSNEYMNQYMKKRWIKRRAEAIVFLGGQCAKCNKTDDLEFDHIDPDTKSMTIARASSRSDEFFWNEVNKCQLLCETHHKEKTVGENSVNHGGGVSGKRNCSCTLCKAKKAEYMKEYWKRNPK